MCHPLLISMEHCISPGQRVLSTVLRITLMRQPLMPCRPKTGRNRSGLTFRRELSACESIQRVYFTFFISIERKSLGYTMSALKIKGITWSEPVWLDPDILPAHIPDSLNFELDENDGLHAVWFYGALEQDARPDWVRYTHSLDGGHTWSSPFLLDQYDEESDHNLTTASPIMIVQGQTVHVIWAAGSLPYRYHRFSTDAGQTWSAPVQIFGELHGQAFDGLAVDGAGRVHFFGQIRYPMGIYHAYWDQTQWSKPSLVYLIAQEDSEEGFGDRVHAHHTLPVIRAGNQLVLTFADGPADPNRRLFVMYRTLDDILPLENMPTPDANCNAGSNVQPDAQATYTNANADSDSSIIRVSRSPAVGACACTGSRHSSGISSNSARTRSYDYRPVVA